MKDIYVFEIVSLFHKQKRNLKKEKNKNGADESFKHFMTSVSFIRTHGYVTGSRYKTEKGWIEDQQFPHSAVIPSLRHR